MNRNNFPYKYMDGSLFFHLALYMNGVGSGDSIHTSVPKIMESGKLPPTPEPLTTYQLNEMRHIHVAKIIMHVIM